MTYQVPESVIYKGKQNYVMETPLDQYLARHIGEINFGGGQFNSSCWRGYKGTWVVEQGKLYLINLDAVGDLENCSRDGCAGGVFCLEDLFPGFGDGAFAHWYTGYLYFSVNQSHINFQNMQTEQLERLTFVNGVCKKNEFVVGRGDEFDFCELDLENKPLLTHTFLRNKVDIWAVEKKHLISESYGRVPTKPFGFLNHAWNIFLDNRHYSDELWYAKIPSGLEFSDEFTSNFDLEGYVFLKNNEFVAEFVI